jgi:hypothetical protein
MGSSNEQGELRQRKGEPSQTTGLQIQGADTDSQGPTLSADQASQAESSRSTSTDSSPELEEKRGKDGKEGKDGSGRRSRFGSISQRMRSPLMSSINLEDLRESITTNVEVK